MRRNDYYSTLEYPPDPPKRRRALLAWIREGIEKLFRPLLQQTTTIALIHLNEGRSTLLGNPEDQARSEDILRQHGAANVHAHALDAAPAGSLRSAASDQRPWDASASYAEQTTRH